MLWRRCTSSASMMGVTAALLFIRFPKNWGEEAFWHVETSVVKQAATLCRCGAERGPKGFEKLQQQEPPQQL